MPLAKNHHYIPQSYQLLFSNDGEKLHFYDKDNEKYIGPARPRNFCSENFLYAFRNSLRQSLDNPNQIESPVLSTIDGRFINSVKILISEEKNKTAASVYDLANFFGFLACRQPSEIHEDEIAVTNKLTDFILDNAKSNPALEKKAKDMGLNIYCRDAFNDLTFSESYNLSLIRMIEKAKNIARALHDEMGWLYLYCESEEYVLNDKPFTQLKPGELSGLSIEDGIYIPISKNLSVIISKSIEGSDYEFVTSEFVSDVNRLIFKRTDRWLIGSSESVLKACVGA